MTAQNLYSLTANNIKGQKFNFDELKGKTVLIVNVASKCGYTNQYGGLQKLYEKYHSRGLEILGFPCNQFLWQEPGNGDEIQSFCTLNYGVNFPIMEKIEVNGSGASPVYDYLKSQKDQPGKLFGRTRDVKWNFEKFLIDKNGNVVNRFGSSFTPQQLEAEIEKIL